MQMTLQDIFLRGITYFYRLNAFLAGTGILSGILLRIFTGQHKASFAILAFGLSCFYIAIASKYLVHNWFLRGEPNPEYETKRRKWLVAYLLMGLPFWLPFGAIVTFSLFDRIYVNTFSINRSPMFDAEMSRILDNDDIRDFQSIQAFDKHRLILAKRDGGASSIMELALQTKKALSSHTHSPSHKYHIVIDNEVYMMTISPHQSRFDWRDFTKKARTHHHLCRLFIPINIEAINETSPSPLRSGTSSIIFIDMVWLH
ncbi:hypothetical protein A9Q99_07980 [Gammaproteobacteria bacterium 45_16_T64]|nr:hypothetical protein A9Q99_07980 [Gammaproteobacteria bacterium 45_16_T64]